MIINYGCSEPFIYFTIFYAILCKLRSYSFYLHSSVIVTESQLNTFVSLTQYKIIDEWYEGMNVLDHIKDTFILAIKQPY